MTQTQNADAGVPAPHEGRPLIALMIDDHEATADTVVFFLRMHGFEAVAAYSGADGLAIALQRRPPIIFCDLIMPGSLDGHKVATAIRATPDYRPVLLAMGSLSTDVYQQRAFAAGFNQYIKKPLDPYQVLAIVRQLMQKSETG